MSDCSVRTIGGRPSANTEGLYIDGSFFDEQFVDQLIAGTPMEIVLDNRERFIRSIPTVP
jgi:hypothetical protein